MDKVNKEDETSINAAAYIAGLEWAESGVPIEDAKLDSMNDDARTWFREGYHEGRMATLKAKGIGVQR